MMLTWLSHDFPHHPRLDCVGETWRSNRAHSEGSKHRHAGLRRLPKERRCLAWGYQTAGLSIFFFFFLKQLCVSRLRHNRWERFSGRVLLSVFLRHFVKVLTLLFATHMSSSLSRLFFIALCSHPRTTLGVKLDPVSLGLNSTKQATIEVHHYCVLISPVYPPAPAGWSGQSSHSAVHPPTATVSEAVDQGHWTGDRGFC